MALCEVEGLELQNWLDLRNRIRKINHSILHSKNCSCLLTESGLLQVMFGPADRKVLLELHFKTYLDGS